MQREWTLERELMEIAGVDSLPEALRASGLCADGDAKVVEVSAWARGGAETYIYVADVLCDNSTKRIVLKALVPVPGTRSVASALQDRLSKKLLLDGISVPTVRVFAAGKGTIIEEYLPLTASEAIRTTAVDRHAEPAMDELMSGRGPDGWQLVFDTMLIAGAIDELRFGSVSSIGDLRSDGRHIYVTDFGEDLGQPFTASSNDATRRECSEWMRAQGVTLPADRLGEMWEAVHDYIDRETSGRPIDPSSEDHGRREDG